MKRFIALLFIIAFSFASLTYSQEAGTKKATPKVKVQTKETKKVTEITQTASNTTKKTGKPIKGRVVSLAQMLFDKVGKVTKEEAMKQAEEGKPIVFLVGEGKKAKVYFVFNEDGSFASKKLAKFADNKFVGIVGKTQVINGLNIIIAEIIESMD
ncbi:MAG: hypothetical protein ACUVQ1_06065 [Candidatus Kapaibacteriales bacterium]